EDTAGRRRIYRQSGIIVAGAIDNLYRQEKSIPCRATVQGWRDLGCITGITQPFEDNVRIQGVTSRDLCHRNAGSRRLQADRPLLFIRPKSLGPPCHQSPQSVRYPWRTLSNTLYPRQSSGAGRLRSQVLLAKR